MGGDKEKCLNARMDDIISMPIDMKNLCEVIERLVGEKYRESYFLKRNPTVSASHI